MGCFNRNRCRSNNNCGCNCGCDNRCEQRRCRPHCMNCFVIKKSCPCEKEIGCNSYPEPVFDECDDNGFIICCC